MFGLGAAEIFIIFVMAVIFIGPKKLPDLAKGLGKAIREFQKAKNELVSSVNIQEDISASEKEVIEKAKENTIAKRDQQLNETKVASWHEEVKESKKADWHE